MRRRAVDYAVYLLVRVLICIVQALSLETGARLARGLAWLLADVLKVRGRVVEENLRHAFPTWSAGQRAETARTMWEHLFLLVLEVAHTPRKLHETNWRSMVALRNHEALVRLLVADRPTLLVTGHFGNFEVAGYVLGILGFPTFTVARTLDNPYLDCFVNAFRGRTGQHIIPKTGGYEEIVAVLSGCGTMTLLADQYAGPKGCWVDFFGRPASAYKSIALLALDFEAPLYVCAARRLEGPMRFELAVHARYDPAVDLEPARGVAEITQWYTRALEGIIRREPSQYWWIHRRWKDTRPSRIRRKAAA